MQSWATDELQHAALGDARRDRRLHQLVEALAAQPTASLPQACGSWAATKGAYRFFSSDRITPAAIGHAQVARTQDRLVDYSTILVLQDTTELNFTQHPATRGLGPLHRPTQQGLLVHSALAASPAGVPLGVLHQAVWTRAPAEVGKRHQRRQRDTIDKESQRWLTAFDATLEAVPPATEVVTVADREADIYDLFARPRRLNTHLLIRATHNRRVEHEARYLWAAIRQTPAGGRLTIDVPRTPARDPRSATLTVRWTTLALHPPRHHRQRAQLPPVVVQVVLVEEEAPPEGETALCWLLLTTLPVAGVAEAVRYVRWYAVRWVIERYHYVLKSGCGIEELQLESAAALKCALATYSIVAWRLLWLTYEARVAPEQPCDGVLEAHEWQALACVTHQTPIPPPTPPTLGEAVRWIAQLGGFLGRSRDGDPGVKTLWRGWQRLHDIAATWRLAHQDPPQQLDICVMGNA